MTAVLLALVLFLGGDPTAAERAYRAGRYQEAYELYREALAQPGAAAGEILCNLGNCAYRLGRHAEAVLHYRRALLRLPGDRELSFHLHLAERQLGTAAADAPAAPRWTHAVDRLPAAAVLALVAGLQSLGLLALVFARGAAARILGAVFVGLGLALAGHRARREWFPGPPEGVVLAPEIALRAAPDSGLPPVLRLRAGEVVRIEERGPSWLRVRHDLVRGFTEPAGVGVVD